MANSPFNSLLRKLPSPLRNRFYVLSGVFIFWMVFIDKHDILTQWKLRQTVKKQQAEMAQYKQQLIDIQQDKQDMDKNMEKFAREHFYMHKSDEEVFILEETE
jgi:cell division protein DivIC